jgi:hypothetical protein
MAKTLSWNRYHSLRAQLPPNVTEAIESVGADLPPEAEAETVVAALRARDLKVLHAIAGLVVINDMPLSTATWLVHSTEGYRTVPTDPEESYAALYKEIANQPRTTGQQNPNGASPQPDESGGSVRWSGRLR